MADLGVVAGFVALLAVAPGSILLQGIIWALVTVGFPPYAVYRDAWYASTHSDWAGGPQFWATLAALPFLDIVTVPAYLASHVGATCFTERPSFRESAVGTIRLWL